MSERTALDAVIGYADMEGADEEVVRDALNELAAFRRQRALIGQLVEALRLSAKYTEQEDEGVTTGVHTEGCYRFGDARECICGVEDWRKRRDAALASAKAQGYGGKEEG